MGATERETDQSGRSELDANDSTELADIATLKGGLSPRLDGISLPHARQLAELIDKLPPIVVHRPTMRVVDGMHRLHAARARGERVVPVVYVEGSNDDAFLAAVRLNAVHGMPLSARDRSAAAARILRSHPHWSDRRIAFVCGVAPKTVAGLRQRSTDDGAQLNARIGRDGRRHPVSAEDGRKQAAEIMRCNPTVSVREVARRAGISVGTAADVRRRIAATPHAATKTRLSAATNRAETASPTPSPPVDRILLDRILHDPSLRYNERGRALLRLVSATLAFVDQTATVADTVPNHCRESLRTLAELCATGWHDFGRRLADVGLELTRDRPAA